MNPLQLRKQLLLAESELNRVQLAADIAALRVGTRSLTDRVRSFSTIAASVALLVTALMALRRGWKGSDGSKFSWLQTIFKGASLISKIWRPASPPGPAPNETLS